MNIDLRDFDAREYGLSTPTNPAAALLPPDDDTTERIRAALCRQRYARDVARNQHRERHG